jgi:DNA-binding NarL/FixJ family response regulator
MPIRVLIAENHDYAIARAALRLLVAGLSGTEVIGDTGNREEALAIAGQKRPEIILFNLIHGNDNEFQLLSELLVASDQSRAIVLTHSEETHHAQQAVRHGALGVVRVQQSPEILKKAIECVHAGEIWLERTLAASALRHKTQTPVGSPNAPEMKIATLTEREREVIVLMCEGMKNQAIANRLFISEATVRHRLTAIFEKLQVSDRLELVIFAYRHQLAQLPR